VTTTPNIRFVHLPQIGQVIPDTCIADEGRDVGVGWLEMYQLKVRPDMDTATTHVQEGLHICDVGSELCRQLGSPQGSLYKNISGC
jgi:hypothetical protein